MTYAEASALTKVSEFHNLFRHPVGAKPNLPSPERCELRINLLQEELNELRDALAKRDLVEAADALCDLQYVLSGAIHELGLGHVFADLFGEVHRERVWDVKPGKPAMRLMTEVYKVSELYLKLADVLEGRKVEVHLDINPDEQYGSSCVISQAVGYIKGTCNVIPFVKPEAFAASYAADRFKSLAA
mgnify:CR=1 FL=1